MPVFSVYFNFNFCHQTTCKQAACDGWWCTENRFTIFRCLCGKFALSGERKKSYTFELLHIILWILLESSLYFHVPQYKYNYNYSQELLFVVLFEILSIITCWFILINILVIPNVVFLILIITVNIFLYILSNLCIINITVTFIVMYQHCCT